MLDYILAHLHIGENEEGQTMAEYAVVLAVITIVVVLALGLLSTAISNRLGDVVDIITPAG